MSSATGGSALIAFQTIQPSAMIGIFSATISHMNAHPKVPGSYPRRAGVKRGV
jgi:hypothetical protein